MGINNGFRTVDLLKLKISDIKSVKPNQAIQIKESKTGKTTIPYSLTGRSTKPSEDIWTH